MVERGVQRDLSANASRYERIDPTMVERIIFNEELLQNSPDKRVRQFSDPDYLLSHAGFFAIGKASDLGYTPPDQLKLQPPSSYRAFSLRLSHGFVDEHGNAYGQINVKGAGTTHEKSWGAEGSSDPIGIFGERHAIQDMHVSNVFTAHGGRASRGIAVMTFNHAALKNLQSQQSEGYDLGRQLEKTEANGDTACLYVRLLGGDRTDTVSVGATKISRRPFTYSEMVNRAYETILFEQKERGVKAFQDRYLLPESILNRLFVASQDISDTVANMAVLALLNAHFFNFNNGIYQTISKAHFGGNLTANLYEGNQDITGMWVDFENALPESDQVIKTMSKGYSRFLQSDDLDFKSKIIRIEQDAYAAGQLMSEALCPDKKC